MFLMVRLYTVSTVKRVLEIKDRQKEQQGPGTNISQEFTERVNEANTHWWGGFQGEHLKCPHLPPCLSLLTSGKAIGELSDFTAVGRA